MVFTSGVYLAQIGREHVNAGRVPGRGLGQIHTGEQRPERLEDVELAGNAANDRTEDR